MKKIFICSPYSGDIEKNTAFAQQQAQLAIAEGHAPYAPHLFFPQFLDENDPKHRRIGIAAGVAFLLMCDEVWCFPTQDDILTAGMTLEIEIATKNSIPISRFNSCVYSQYTLDTR